MGYSMFLSIALSAIINAFASPGLARHERSPAMEPTVFSTRVETLLLWQDWQGGRSLNRGRVWRTAGACDPPRDVSGCSTIEASELQKPEVTVSKAPFVVKTSDGRSYYTLPIAPEAEKQLATVPSGVCNPPHQVSGCHIVSPSAFEVNDHPDTKVPFTLQLPSGGLLFSVPMPNK